MFQVRTSVLQHLPVSAERLEIEGHPAKTERRFRDLSRRISPNVQDILTNFEFRNQIRRFAKADFSVS
jgi:hypothetical protein